MIPIQVQDIENKDNGMWKSLRLLCFAVVSCGLLKSTEVSAWTYHFNTNIMTWNEAYDYCEKTFTGMVFIRSKEESSFLKDNLQPADKHYWIGIRKKTQAWIRVGSSISRTQDVENWAPGEPNNKNNAQECVEIYLGSHKYSGKWNDENCNKKKRALCYLVSCQDSSCNQHGECVETAGNSTCNCWPGFHGANCKNVVSCMALQSAEHGQFYCTDTFEEFQYKSICRFSCEEGFEMKGSKSLLCQNSGEWSGSAPTCLAVSCRALQKPEYGHINCTDTYGKFQYKSICRFSCEEGFELKGSKSLLCQTSGEWSEISPSCLAVSCMTLQRPEHGQINCSDAFGKSQYNSVCSFSCEEGFELKGSKSLLCQTSGEWSGYAPACLAVSCMILKSPEYGQINCSDAFGKSQYKSMCNFSCEEGFELKGSKSLLCQTSGEWSASAPTCLAGSCTTLQTPELGLIICTDVYGESQYNSVCNFTCKEGFEIKGSNSLLCQSSGEWTEAPPTCLAQNSSPAKQHQFATVGSSLAATGLTLSGIIAFAINRFRKKRNPSLLKSHKKPANTFDNPAFEDNDINSFEL